MGCKKKTGNTDTNQLTGTVHTLFGLLIWVLVRLGRSVAIEVGCCVCMCVGGGGRPGGVNPFFYITLLSRFS